MKENVSQTTSSYFNYKLIVWKDISVIVGSTKGFNKFPTFICE